MFSSLTRALELAGKSGILTIVHKTMSSLKTNQPFLASIGRRKRLVWLSYSSLYSSVAFSSPDELQVLRPVNQKPMLPNLHMSSSSLRREIGLFQAVTYGVGIIVGAGIYALIGKAAGHAGNAIWASFLFSATIASFTGLSYARLSSIFPKSAAEYVYAREAFGSRFAAFIVGWLIILSGVISSSAVALGFGGYLRPYLALPETASAILLTVLLALVNFWGIQKSVRLNALFTLLEVFGLILVVAFGIRYLGSVDYLEAPMGIRGIVSAAALVFFAFIGFEALVKMGEETKDPERTIPRALMISLMISALLYALVGISSISVVPYSVLASSASPLAEVALRAQGSQAFTLLSIIALFATANTVLIIQISTSRIIYGIAKESSANTLAKIHPTTGTPHYTILLTAIASIAFILLGDIELVANVTNLVTFLVFLSVNLALVLLSRQKSHSSAPRLAIGRGYLLSATVGVFASAAMLLQFDLPTAGISVIVVLLGGVIYKAT